MEGYWSSWSIKHNQSCIHWVFTPLVTGVYHWNSNDSKSLLYSQTFTILEYLNGLNVFFAFSLSNYFLTHFMTVPCAPIMIDTNVTFILYYFQSSINF